jgi:hypothetical protein
LEEDEEIRFIANLTAPSQPGAFNWNGTTFIFSGDLSNSEGKVNGVRHYGNSSTDPSSPTPADGDVYYNTVLRMEMRYDGSRSKWLSVESQVFEFGRSGNTAANAYYRGTDAEPYSASSGRTAEWNGTVVGLGYTRSDSDSATFQVTSGGTTIASLASAATSGRSNSLNGDFSQDAILGVRNAPGGNTTSGVLGWVRIKWRAT